MPAISRLLIRTAAVHLVAAMALGVVAVLPGDLVGPGLRPGVGVSAVHLLTVGWITQLVFGVALWMFPRRGSPRDLPDRALDRVAWGLLNAGLLARVAAEPGWILAAHGPARGWTLAASAVAQWAAVVYFAARLWRRVGSR